MVAGGVSGCGSAPDGSLTANASLAAVTELCGRLSVIEALDAAVARSSSGIAASEPGSC